MKLSDWLTILAIVAGPILAVQAQAYVERSREERRRKLWLFRELMATRGSRLSARHVEALNLIELEYTQNNPKQRPVYLAWRAYFDLLNTPPSDPKSPQSHYERRDDRLAALLSVMGSYLGFDFDEVAVRRNVYAPQGHDEAEHDFQIIRRALAKIFTSRTRGIPIFAVDQNFEGPPAVTQEDFGGFTPVVRRDGGQGSMNAK